MEQCISSSHDLAQNRQTGGVMTPWCDAKCHNFYYSWTFPRRRPHWGVFLILVCGHLFHTTALFSSPPVGWDGCVFVLVVKRRSRVFYIDTHVRCKRGRGKPFLEIQGACRDPWAGVKNPSVCLFHASLSVFLCESHLLGSHDCLGRQEPLI